MHTSNSLNGRTQVLVGNLMTLSRRMNVSSRSVSIKSSSRTVTLANAREKSGARNKTIRRQMKRTPRSMLRTKNWLKLTTTAVPRVAKGLGWRAMANQVSHSAGNSKVNRRPHRVDTVALRGMDGARAQMFLTILGA